MKNSGLIYREIKTCRTGIQTQALNSSLLTTNHYTVCKHLTIIKVGSSKWIVMKHSDWGIGSGFREETPENFLYKEMKFRESFLEETAWGYMEGNLQSQLECTFPKDDKEWWKLRMGSLDKDRVLSKNVTWSDLGQFFSNIIAHMNPLGDLVKIQILIQFKSYEGEGRLRFGISNKLSGESGAAISHFE